VKVKFVEISKKEYLCIVVDGGKEDYHNFGDISLFVRQNYHVRMIEEYNCMSTDRRIRMFDIVNDNGEISNEMINAIEDFILGFN